VKALATVFHALDQGLWDPDVELLHAAGALVDSTSRWALVVELEVGT
jgi:hypothetical protein